MELKCREKVLSRCIVSGLVKISLFRKLSCLQYFSAFLYLKFVAISFLLLKK